MLTSIVELMNRYLPPILVVGLCLGTLSCAPSDQADLPATVEEIEEATESFANLMLDIGLSIRDGNLGEFRAVLAPRIVSGGFPRSRGTTTGFQSWLHRRDEAIAPRPESGSMTRDGFLFGLRTFLDGWTELEDVRLKVKKSILVEDSISGQVALSIVGRDSGGQRMWFRSRADVRAGSEASTGGWTIDQFEFSSAETLVAESDVFSEVAVPAGIDRVDPPFLARQGPPEAGHRGVQLFG